MNTKRIVRWSIVLLLLAALPGLTAALGQGQEPAGKAPLPAVTEMGESATNIPWVNNEINPNNAVDQVHWFPVMPHDFEWGGKIDAPGDVDYWGFYWDDRQWCNSDEDCDYEGLMETSMPILIDIEAVSIGSSADTVICLYSDDGYELSCNDDTDTHDSMLFYNIEVHRFYFLKVSNWSNAGGSNYKYQVLISSPLLISAAAGGLGTGNVAGIPFQAGDILAWNDFRFGNGQREEKWVMLFDLSDLNVKGNVTSLTAGWRNSDTLLLGFAANATLPGISGPVTPWEVVTFDPSQIGPFTQGTFQRWWDGRQQGLTLAAEKPDAIDWPIWNGAAQLRVSTTGKATVPFNPSGEALKLADEDVGLWNATNGKWIWDFDGHTWYIPVKKDVIAMAYSYYWWDAGSYDTFLDDYYLVLNGTSTLSDNYGNQTTGTQKDIFLLRYGFTMFWRGSDHGWNYNIDAIDLVVERSGNN